MHHKCVTVQMYFSEWECLYLICVTSCWLLFSIKPFHLSPPFTLPSSFSVLSFSFRPSDVCLWPGELPGPLYWDHCRVHECGWHGNGEGPLPACRVWTVSCKHVYRGTCIHCRPHRQGTYCTHRPHWPRTEQVISQLYHLIMRQWTLHSSAFSGCFHPEWLSAQTRPTPCRYTTVFTLWWKWV